MLYIASETEICFDFDKCWLMFVRIIVDWKFTTGLMLLLMKCEL